MQNLFKDVPEANKEANKEGTKQILVCYKSGRLYFEAIFKQDILKTEPCITYGHGAQNITYHIFAKLEKIKKKQEKKSNRIVIYEEITHSELLDSEFLFSIQISNTENHKVQVR
ncbi:hypothetical protein C2G38_2232116 [Gigaspora rosea]|uniref:Uncharacterized protein n=1 Tax=Gigaspora rosea TaxID=44941 RepID=A0A397U0T6_9GLOM|nr:hypothetical protein C2G38_2232116 [Gigaspora rosea]